MELNGRVAFGRMDAVTFGRPANEALLEEIKNYDAHRVFLLASGTLNRNTDEIDKICHAFQVERGAIPAPLNYKGFPNPISVALTV